VFHNSHGTHRISDCFDLKNSGADLASNFRAKSAKGDFSSVPLVAPGITRARWAAPSPVILVDKFAAETYFVT